MNKAKFLLSAVGLFAIVAGALASKAKQFDRIFVKTSPETTICSLPVNATLDGASFLTNTAATTIQSAPCVTVPVYEGL
ncbi:hypothetical protein [Chitinophaga sp. sic0106]|uniref:hypothetical protein n=1 Tax=Chitinophaga sp. sic0106 TaxID=2854785 RepID=UPI001C44B100|nr:hypothetical protein [Chitinophaga sp. sic0106]MBV7531385.1 hypothetical protein [Chitinophaga sp. sic0106]